MPLLGAVITVSITQACQLAARRAVVHHVGAADRHLHPQPPPLRALGVPALHMLVDKVHAFDDDLGAPIEDFGDAPRRLFRRRSLSRNPARDDLDEIALFDLHNYTTSLARLTIF